VIGTSEDAKARLRSPNPTTAGTSDPPQPPRRAFLFPALRAHRARQRQSAHEVSPPPSAIVLTT
jgi:hypothetical protein